VDSLRPPSQEARFGKSYRSTDNGFFDREAHFASGTGNLLFLAAGTLLPLVEDGPQGKQHSLRALDSVVASTLITEILKSTVREKRPDSSERDSFPSGHATAAFAVATMQASFHPKQAPLWYGGATIIAASRLQLNRHYVQDVVAGAAVGYFTSRLELRSKRGLLLRPFISNREPGASTPHREAGLSVSGAF
jgi:membrane-associated phospholipid phosphatase